MNVFKKKNKVKDDAYMIPPAIPADAPLPSKLSRSLKRKQKNVVEPKLELDLATALPETNDFRISLLMPGLSARFSMLREQDDPNTKVGKASDDSVLFPKRVSRLNLFAHNPLTDISETESIRLPYRPPFAEPERSQSFSESASYSNDDSSVLNRSRPVEGNNLFGGRQKMYRVPTATSSNRELGDGGTSVAAGKHIYQKDVTIPSYQQYRSKTRDESRERPTSSGTEEHENSSIVNTPSTGFSKSRGTTSSTASGPSNRRTSTAATSIVSDSPAPRQSNLSGGSHTRATAADYGSEESLLKRNFSSDLRKGLPANDHENQPPLPSSPIANRAISQPRSGTNLMDRFTRENPAYSQGNPRALSPTPSVQTQALASLDFGLKQTTHHPRKYQTTNPTYENHESDIYSQSLQPNDRGKATAMGLFNRPRQQFDEQQFQQRQLQMHSGTMSPLQAEHPTARDLVDSKTASTTRPRSPSSPSIRERSDGNESSTSSVKARSRAQSAASAHAGQMHSHVEALIRRQNEEFSAMRSTKAAHLGPSPQETRPDRQLADQPASRGTFFDTFDGSDEDEADLDSPMLGRYEPPPRLAPMEVHPALRDGSQSFDFGEDTKSGPTVPARPDSSVSVDTSSPSVVHDTPDTSDSFHRSSPTKAPDSPTLGPGAGLGLSGLIRTHLRNDSDRSSFMPPPSPGIAQHSGANGEPYRQREASIASTARTINPPESTHSDPWEFDNTHRIQRTHAEHAPSDTVPSMSQKAQQILGQANFHKNQANTKAQQILGTDAPVSGEDHSGPKPWLNDAIAGHQRGESTETQKEFGNELAERARRIQEGFKGAAEVEKRARSPGPFRGDRYNPATQALHALRQKSSKQAMIPRPNESQPKAMKMLGLGNGTSRMEPSRSPNVGPRGDYEFDQGHDQHENRYTPRQRPSEFEHPSGRRTPAYGRPPPPVQMHGSQEDFERSRQRSATPTSGRMPPPRLRAGSEAGERSRSRAGRDREEPPHHQVDYGRQGPHQRPPHWEQRRPKGPPPVHPHGPPMDARDYERSSSSMSNRRPSNSRPNPSGYFDIRSATPTTASTPTLGTGQISNGPPRLSPRPPFPHSPMSPFPAMNSPGFSAPQSAIHSALPSPVVPMHAPPSGRSTPVLETRALPPGASARKKSVTKGMISEPTFISSTSSVPLVGLPISPRPGQIATPPVPVMNPRRRGNTMSEKPDAFPSPRMVGSPKFPDSTAQPGYGDLQQRPPPRQRNRLRKISSEGGSMAARARNQAIMAEFGHERLHSPAVPVFPNRSATSLSMHQDGGMF